MSPSKKFLRYAHVSVVDTGVSCNNGETISCCLRSCIWHRHRGFLAELAIMLRFLHYNTIVYYKKLKNYFEQNIYLLKIIEKYENKEEKLYLFIKFIILLMKFLFCFGRFL